VVLIASSLAELGITLKSSLSAQQSTHDLAIFRPLLASKTEQPRQYNGNKSTKKRNKKIMENTAASILDNLLKFQHAAELIEQADALVIAVGAGMGVDSGLPDFRGNEGFWKAYPAIAAANLDFMDVASPRTFRNDPKLAWGFYGHRLNLYRQTIPHQGFEILRGWCERMLLGSWVFTSNVDGQFQKAGFPDDVMHECHGSIHQMQCMSNCKSDTWSANQYTPTVNTETCQLLSELPVCPHCGGLARPNILMFGDEYWQYMYSEKQRRNQERWLNAIEENKARVVVVEIGAGTAIPSVRHFSQRIIHEYCGRLVRINPREFQVPSSYDVGIDTGSFEALIGINKNIQTFG
jgi:NAD-dependent SIR2 family protein deacetylase